MTEQTDADTDAKGRFRREATEFVRFIAGAAAVYLLITTVIFRVFYIPSESMQPTLEVGDRVMVLNFIYGWSRHSLPLGVGEVLPSGDGRILGFFKPKRGDVVVFRHPKGREHLIKRVIGLPGDRIEMHNGRLFVNGEITDRTPVDVIRYRTHKEGRIVAVTRYDEDLPDGPTHAIYERTDDAELDDLDIVFTVLPNHLFVMGDNRDASNDSRNPYDLGYIPVENVIGKAVTVIFTLKRCKREPALTCPTGRVWRPL